MTSIENDLEQQTEELMALEAIYGDDNCTVAHQEHCCEVRIPGNPTVVLRVHLPDTYPSTSAPIAELAAPHLSDDVVSGAVQQLLKQFQPGEIVLYTWIEWLRERAELRPPAAKQHESPLELDQDLAAALRLEDDPEQCTEGDLAAEQDERQRQGSIWQQAKLEAAARHDRHEIDSRIVHGEPFTERKSTFQAHVAPVKSLEEVHSVMAVLLENGKVQRATHNIMAYRVSLKDRNSFLQDSDDDGESAAGGRLLHLLQVVGAQDVVVVVSRWYGGILLGPARFTHINNAARKLLDQCGYISKDASSKKKKSK